MNKFDKICSDIKSLKIQGATNVAKAGLEAYYLKPSSDSIEKISSLRPTEPALFHALKLVKKIPKEKIFSHFEDSQKKINSYVFKLIKNNSVVYTHCHSCSVSKALIFSHKKKKFSVLNTETRPLYQGRLTARELAKAKIKVTTYVDSGMHEAVENSDIIFLGADAILSDGVINKIGSTAIAEIAFVHKKPFYIVADSWKFSSNKIKIEERDFHEVWKNLPKGVKVKNPAFEKIPRKYIKGIVSELGTLSYSEFISKVT